MADQQVFPVIEETASSDDRGFIISDLPEPHRSRTRKLLDDHPEIRGLFGKNPWTLAIAVGLVGGQFSMAYLLKDQAWWVVLLAAWLVGAFPVHALFVVIHEATHRLVLRSSNANRLVGIFANLPMFIPTAVSFERCHLKHHAYQGVYDYDVDLPSHWEVKLFGDTAIGKALWLLVLPFVLAIRPLRLKAVPLFDSWVVLNWVAVFAADLLVLWAWGPMALLYLGLSLLFSIGLHPLGARWIQEHYTSDDEQETFSYYGPLNYLALNVGYHNEHHDLPAVPWNRLPAVKAAAGEMYNSLRSYKSWGGLLLHFLFGGKLSIRSRVTRGVEVARNVKSDVT
ncbi:MAG: fatty acid desaturase [Anderseniella sp.]|nr:fatty acid desaturase [Anderseniella sp.]